MIPAKSQGKLISSYRNRVGYQRIAPNWLDVNGVSLYASKVAAADSMFIKICGQETIGTPRKLQGYCDLM